VSFLLVGGVHAQASAASTPILVVASDTNPFSRYYGEILQAEGLNEFTVVDLSLVTSTVLALYDVVILGELPLTVAQVSMFSNYVMAGGNLIAMRPDKQLTGLLGLTAMASTLLEGYLLVDTSRPPGQGIVNQTIQFHGTADLYTLAGASSIVTLYSDAATATVNPAVTLRSVGTAGGHAAAFTFDLARSTVYSRQGNPAWAGQERDTVPPIRSNDLYWPYCLYSTCQPFWVDPNKVAIPQADELQRVLANLIQNINLGKKPLPRFWYFPRGFKAVIIMTGDDHATGGTAGRFDSYKTASVPGCSVDNWECIRSSSYIYPNYHLSDAQAAAYTADGFEVGVHFTSLNSSYACIDYTFTSLDGGYTTQLNAWKATYPSVPSPSSERTHCVVWSDWASQPLVQLSHGIRLDTTYYYWGLPFTSDHPGFFTGSGMPMRFAKMDGTPIDVYQATTQMTDESSQAYPFTVDALLDKALGPEGYYGAFTANMHTDLVTSAGSDAILASAKTRGVPIVSGRQMLKWLDGRNASSFSAITFASNALSFTLTVGSGATGLLQAMVPTTSPAGRLSAVSLGTSPVAYTIQTIKGIEYAIFPAATGTYQASYGSATVLPDLTVSALTVPSQSTAGASISVNDTTANAARTSRAAASTTRFYLSNTSTLGSGAVTLGSRAVPSLTPGQTNSSSITVTIPAATAAGAYFVIAVADADGVVSESNETNNTTSQTITVTAAPVTAPDLFISALSVSGSMKRGNPMNISDTVTNKAGTSTAGSSTTNFYLSTTSTFGSGATLLGSRAVSSLGAGASNSGSTKVTIPTTIAVGNYFLIAVADANSNVAESNETNNTASIAIAISN